MFASRSLARAQCTSSFESHRRQRVGIAGEEMRDARPLLRAGDQSRLAGLKALLWTAHFHLSRLEARLRGL
ncbi:hypothetical protein MRX96_007810 [Rhipicephalus microplus]